jgi:dihydroorotate dehydrogenase
MNFYPVIRSLLFRLPPELVHHLTLRMMRLSGQIGLLGSLLRVMYSVPDRPVQVLGMQFKNPVGLAAGYDKDGIAWRGLTNLGFGHIEIGTVTLKPQPGNPRPRLFRLPEDRAIINRMGFSGLGSAFVAREMAGKRPPGVILGVNLGKNKTTPLESAVDDYLALMDIFAPLADYLAINISSPNTVGLRRLQERQAMQALLETISQKRQDLQADLGKRTPLFVKLAPDLTDEGLDEALQVLLDTGMDGVIATNTTVQRQGLRSSLSSESGGLSGAPLAQNSTRMIRKISSKTDGKLPIIGVGGIMDYASAKEKLDAGACLVQVYTGLVYTGPGLVRSICQNL